MVHWDNCRTYKTHSSVSPSQGSHVSPALDRLPALPLQVWLTGLEQDGPPTPPFQSPQTTLLLLGGPQRRARSVLQSVNRLTNHLTTHYMLQAVCRVHNVMHYTVYTQQLDTCPRTSSK